jgi:hypothetical protein
MAFFIYSKNRIVIFVMFVLTALIFFSIVKTEAKSMSDQIQLPQRGSIVEEVWAGLKVLEEHNLRLTKSVEELVEDRKLREKEQEQRKKEDAEGWASLRKTMDETSRKMKETDRRIGELGNRFGELAEHLVAPNIMEKFNALGYSFGNVYQNCIIRGPEGALAEIDILLENGETSIAVEVKAKLLQRDVDEHIERMEVLRIKRIHNAKIFLGALAGAIVTPAVKDYALRAGFYVIEQSGDTVKIDVPENFKPRAW